MMNQDQENDVIVVGAGASGLIAAGQAALNGSQTLLVEKMDLPGIKLRITGKGRCNLTNIAPLEEFIGHFGKNGQFLRQAFARFFVQDLLEFLEKIGVQATTERGGRVFPSNADASALTEKLVLWVAKYGVTMRTNSPVERILTENQKAKGIQLRNGEILYSKTVVLATGGASYSSTGSSGDGYRMAEECGHTIVPIRPALVPLKTKGNTAKRMQGLSLRNVQVSVFINKKPVKQAFGELLFTHFGLSGPVVLTLSGFIVDALHDDKSVHITIDLKPALDEKKLDARILRELDKHGKRGYQSMLKTLLPQSLIPVCVDQTRIPAQMPCHQITAAQRMRLLKWLKDFRLEVNDHLPLEAAIITAGGVALNEVNPRTMESRLVKGLFFAGEVLDLDADTGGYNLQAAFSTGWLAGTSVTALSI